jgi:two-component system LytT family response regulator
MGLRLVVKTGKKTLLLQPEQISWVQAEKDYVRLHQGAESFLVRSTIQSMAEKLDPTLFMRVHRSTIVNLNHVKEMKPLNSGDYEILMDDERRLTLSRGYRNQLREMLRSEGISA